jgi:hypothetical protein
MPSWPMKLSNIFTCNDAEMQKHSMRLHCLFLGSLDVGKLGMLCLCCHFHPAFMATKCQTNKITLSLAHCCDL